MSELTMSAAENTGGRPWHLWLFGVLAVLWNCMGALDYVMTQTKNQTYMSQFTQEKLDYFYSIPTWAVATWAIAVWGGLLGSVLLVIGLKVSRWIFLVSLISLSITFFQNYVLTNGLEIMGDAFSIIFTALIVIVAIALLWYSFALTKQGILR